MQNKKLLTKTELRQKYLEAKRNSFSLATNEERMACLIEEMRLVALYHKQEYIDDVPSTERTRGKFNIGNFEITSGKAIITDPCYKPGVWCSGILDNVKNGKWSAEVLIKETEWYDRVWELTAQVENCDIKFLKMEKCNFSVGVDSGQAGIFDLQHYPAAPRDSDFYEKACFATGGEPFFGDPVLTDKPFYPQAGLVDNFGVVSASGFGDGGYSCTIGKNNENEICLIKITFISDAPDEEDE